jgi:localization factor PodJL
MQNVLGQQASNAQAAQAPTAVSTQQGPDQPQPVEPAPDLQSRLAAIAKNIETLESKVSGGSVAPAPVVATTAEQASAPSPQRSFDPLEALRRRKHELEHGHVPTAAPAPVEVPAAPQQGAPEPAAPPPAPEQPVHAPAPSATLPEPAPTPDSSGLDQLISRLDEQFSRLTDAVVDVRSIAESSAADQAGLHQQVAALKARVDNGPMSATAPGAPQAVSGPDLAQLSDQIRAVQDTIAAMPKPEAIQSLEDGYRHVLSRLDTLKDVGAHDEKIDALYGEVTSLREVLDNLSENNTGALVGEMRSMIAQLENDPHSGADRITEALESVKAMAANAAQEPNVVNEAIGAVVERLVALEARIEALASGADDSAVTQRLDAIQTEMARLSTFQDEARGLTSALDTIREEMRNAAPAIDMAGIDQRFSALDRIEEMTGGYAAQVADLSERLNALDGRLANQADMAREVAALSRQMDSFSSTMPVREIEHALLDLTGRVTALQENDGTARLGMAVRELGERVESCLKSIPKTEAIIEAVEAKIDSRLSSTIEPLASRLDTVDQRLDGIQRAISAADAPLIDHMSNRLEGLIQAMPTPLADVALASLESQLVELNKRHSEAGIISRDDVNRLHAELARARASVELGSNRDLQRAIVDQVRHLAARFDTARSTGDAGILPEIESEINDLANRVQSLGLFDPQAETQDALGMQALQGELVALRENASDQDQRMLDTLESVQSALETVIGRIDALETDDLAARHLAKKAAVDTPTPKPQPSMEETAHAFDRSSESAREPQPATTDADAQPVQTVSSLDDVLPRASLPEEEDPPSLDLSSMAVGSDASNDEIEDDKPDPDSAPNVIPAPGDAQTLLRQLSGAINAAPQRPARSSHRAKATAATTPDANAQGDTGNQRASFIAAARRAAQAAALQAGGGSPAGAAPQGSNGADAMSRPNLAGSRGRQHGEARIEPGLDKPGLDKPGLDEPGLNAPASSPTTPSADLSDNPMSAFGGAAKTARKQQTEPKAGDEKRQRVLSRTMLFALVLITLGLGLFVVNLIMPGDRAADTVIAPIAPTEAPVSDASGADVSAAPDETVRTVGDEVSLAPSDDALPPEQSPLESADGVAEAGAPVESELATDSPRVSEDALTRDGVVGSGFERDRGPVMAQTPQMAEAATDELAALQDARQPTAPQIASQESVLPPPANDLGPLLNLPTPSLPAATADALPEAIGSPRLRVAAASGDPAAAFEIATRFMEGRFVAQDLGAAAHWYGRAAAQGVIPAAYRLGSFYEQGRGVDRDRNGAIAWYERAALGGNPRAMHNLAVMAAEGGGQSPDFARAAGWFIPAANRGLADSQFNLAVLYARGMGVERDLMESYKWFALAANAGDNEAVARRDEVAGVLGEQALALARARVDNWRAVPVETAAVAVQGPEGGWDDVAESASATPTQRLIAEAQALLAERGYNPGPADGLLGPRTNEAVRAFRQSVGLGDSDTIDQALLDALRQGRSL